ncbi:hypothetical protein MGYG_08966 [Nannizzia gypsea CBS 118893]|uniref:Uncharacterized protein n=1 Tax=Arthroderma gypseum (strain ATCC MYA-4604 / CBS 118893) TaxID=535722 RepID=E4UQV9_ARTGP|nr:hypothetical protein MGYG_08966 [Nannizzia gypsea CBS 118893]EFQ99285.1 hypothetical protein MGYG_08966 [Nannizzia gypsea CBS 118893]
MRRETSYIFSPTCLIKGTSLTIDGTTPEIEKATWQKRERKRKEVKEEASGGHETIANHPSDRSTVNRSEGRGGQKREEQGLESGVPEPTPTMTGGGYFFPFACSLFTLLQKSAREGNATCMYLYIRSTADWRANNRIHSTGSSYPFVHTALREGPLMPFLPALGSRPIPAGCSSQSQSCVAVPSIPSQLLRLYSGLQRCSSEWTE